MKQKAFSLLCVVICIEKFAYKQRASTYNYTFWICDQRRKTVNGIECEAFIVFEKLFSLSAQNRLMS